MGDDGRPRGRGQRASATWTGKDVVELGCGTAYVSAWLARRGRAAGRRSTSRRAQLETARRMQAEFGLEFPLVQASAEDVPLPDASFDLVVSEYGASIWADPYRWIPEAARLLRPGGQLVFLVNGTLVVLCSPDEDLPAGTRAPAAVLRHAPVRVAGRRRRRVPPRLRRLDPPARRNGFEVEDLIELQAPEGATASRHDLFTPEWARAGRPRRSGGRARRVSVPPAPPLLLASTSPQRRAILEQLGIPFDVVAPRYEEDDPPDADPVDLVRAHARGRHGRSPARPATARCSASTRRSCCDGRVLRQARRAPRTRPRCWRRSAGRTHKVVSGLCLVTPGWEERRARRDAGDVPPADRRAISPPTWRPASGRAGRARYAIQGRGAALVERIEGDYLNVVGLPAALLVRLLAERFPGVYGFG